MELSYHLVLFSNETLLWSTTLAEKNISLFLHIFVISDASSLPRKLLNTLSKRWSFHFEFDSESQKELLLYGCCMIIEYTCISMCPFVSANKNRGCNHWPLGAASPGGFRQPGRHPQDWECHKICRSAVFGGHHRSRTNGLSIGEQVGRRNMFQIQC